MLYTRRKKAGLIVIAILLLVGSFQSCLIGRVDRTPYQQTDYYREFNEQFSETTANLPAATGDTIRVGWAKVNITPAEPVSLAGYGQRLGKKYTSVHDSIYVRAFVFSNGIQKAAFVTMDLLIVPPEVTEALHQALPKVGFSIDQTYLTATHSHNSIGGWAKKPVGNLLAGRFRPRIVSQLTKHILTAIRQADQQKQPARLGYAQYQAGELVRHRIVKQGKTDSLLRVLKIEQVSGKTALLVTFAAHATCLPAKETALSRDYPGALVDSLEKHVDFAAFSAGGVGSHRPVAFGDGYEKMGNLAHLLSRKMLIGFSKIPLYYQTNLRCISVPLPLGEPQWRIARDFRLRPWVFYELYGDYPASLTGLQIGNVTFVGTPCDFSGEITADVPGKVPLIITSFNGGYIGYVTADKYYDVKHYETRAMNWFGPGNGAYLKEAVLRVAEKVRK